VVTVGVNVGEPANTVIDVFEQATASSWEATSTQISENLRPDMAAPFL
jgi:hypothetical protein